MDASERTVFIALLCLSCGSGNASRRPSEPEPRPTCFTGAGAIDIPSPAPPEAHGPAREAYGVGGLGVVGRTGSGATEGTIGLGNLRHLPFVIPGQPLFQGAIDRDDLRKTVRRHLDNLATCRASAATDFGGRIVVDFVIDPQGRVERSSIRSSTGGDRNVDACVGEHACRWTFTAPRDGGKAVVSYPLVFTTGETRD